MTLYKNIYYFRYLTSWCGNRNLLNASRGKLRSLVGLVEAWLLTCIGGRSKLQLNSNDPLSHYQERNVPPVLVLWTKPAKYISSAGCLRKVWNIYKFKSNYTYELGLTCLMRASWLLTLVWSFEGKDIISLMFIGYLRANSVAPVPVFQEIVSSKRKDACSNTWYSWPYWSCSSSRGVLGLLAGLRRQNRNSCLVLEALVNNWILYSGRDRTSHNKN